jgi:uncharacterized membrane protein SpoIIM required for sporulation
VNPAEAFVRSRGAAWNRFETEATAHHRSGAVPPERIVPFARAYRGVAADLSAARARGCGPEVMRRLNGLVSLGHGVVYRRTAGRRGRGDGAVRSFLLGFPMAFRDNPRTAALALALFLLPALLAFLYVVGEEHRIHEVFPGLETAIAPRDGRPAPSLNMAPATLSSFYIVNNTLVAFRSLAFGILLGLGTAWDLAVNGTLLGGLAAHFANRGDLAGFWPQILPHGVTELLALWAGGLAGLLLARAVWMPGDLSRRDALVECGREVGVLALGCVVLLFWSGLVESWFTRSTDDDVLRNAFTLVAATAVAAWFAVGIRVAEGARARRRATAAAPPSAAGSGSPPPR